MKPTRWGHEAGLTWSRSKLRMKISCCSVASTLSKSDVASKVCRRIFLPALFFSSLTFLLLIFWRNCKDGQFFLFLFERPKRQEVEEHYWTVAQFAGYQATVSYWTSKGTEEGSAVRQGLWSTIQAKSRKCLFHITCSPVLFRIGVPSSSSSIFNQSKIVKDVISGSLLPSILFW